jgi:ABC-type uncharacterized transport system involved in gliding motility auxiliary subunit
VVILINIVGISLFFRLDLTGNKIYSISDASKEAVATLSEPLTIKVFFTKNLPAPHNNTERYLRDLLGEYAIYANKYFNYNFFDVSPDSDALTGGAPENQRLAQDYGINPVQIRIVEQDEIKFKNAYMGLVLIHGDIIEKIPAITSSDGLEYELTTAIQKMNNKISALLALPDKIQIQFYMSSSLEEVAMKMGLDELRQLPDAIAKKIEKLNAKNYGKLAFEYLNPSTDPALKPIVEKHNIMTLKWPAFTGDKINAGSGSIGMLMTYGKKTIEIPILRVVQFPVIGTRYELVSMDDLENLINENVASLIDINENIGFLADHGTLSLDSASRFNPMAQKNPDATSAFSSLISQNYNIKPIILASEGIPESLNCLIIARPTESFSDYELFQIDQFLMRGKSLAIFMDAFKEEMPQNRQMMGVNQGSIFRPLSTGLEKLLKHYGLRVKSSYVMDENSHKQTVPQQFGGGQRSFYFAPLIKRENINQELAFMQNINGLVVVKASPLLLDTERVKVENITAHQLFTSSDRSWEMKGRINLNPMFITPPGNDKDMAALPLSYLLEGTFPSYFDGKEIPEKPVETESADAEKKDAASVPTETNPDKNGQQKVSSKTDMSQIERSGGVIYKSKPAKIFLIASSEMLKNTVLDESGKSPNAMFVMNAIDTLNGRDDTAVMRSKEQRFNPLYDTDALTKMVVKVFNIIGLPILVAVFGSIVWIKRHARRRQIQMMFQR